MSMRCFECLNAGWFRNQTGIVSAVGFVRRRKERNSGTGTHAVDVAAGVGLRRGSDPRLWPPVMA